MRPWTGRFGELEALSQPEPDRHLRSGSLQGAGSPEIERGSLVGVERVTLNSFTQDDQHQACYTQQALIEPQLSDRTTKSSPAGSLGERIHLAATASLEPFDYWPRSCTVGPRCVRWAVVGFHLASAAFCRPIKRDGARRLLRSRTAGIVVQFARCENGRRFQVSAVC